MDIKKDSYKDTTTHLVYITRMDNIMPSWWNCYSDGIVRINCWLKAHLKQRFLRLEDRNILKESFTFRSFLTGKKNDIYPDFICISF